MNVTALADSALLRVLGDEGGGAFGPVGAAVRPAMLVPAITPNDSLRAVTGNRIPPPGVGGKIEQPRGLAADRMEQVQADIPQDGAMSGLLTVLVKFNEAQRLER